MGCFMRENSWLLHKAGVIFGKDMVRNAWFMVEYDRSRTAIAERDLDKQEAREETCLLEDTVDFDGEDGTNIVIEFQNGNKVIFQSSDFANMSKFVFVIGE